MQFSLQSARHHIHDYVHQALVNDLAAGLTGAVAGAPQAMAFAIVAGISPIYGLYTAIVATIVSSVLGSSTYMTTGPTNALAVVLGSTLAPFSDSGDLVSRLVTLTFLVGVIQAAMGILRLGELTRYVSTAVMVGFITGSSILLLLGQLRHLMGIPAGVEATILEATAELFTHLGNLHLPTLIIGIVTIGLIVVLHRTRFASFATLAAIVLTGAAIIGLGWDDVELVRDQSPITERLPDFSLPNRNLAGEMLPAALAIGLLGLVQTAALSQSIKEPDDRIPDASREFIGQGLGNLAGAFLQKIPAGGSVSRRPGSATLGQRSSSFGRPSPSTSPSHGSPMPSPSASCWVGS
jgi:SulP family sulfate permease